MNRVMSDLDQEDLAQALAKAEQARDIIYLVRDLDDYEATIALAYIKRLIKSRTKENRD
jgi:hypothetical protein